MSTYDNQPPLEGWQVTCRCDEAACERCHPAPRIGANIVLGSE